MTDYIFTGETLDGKTVEGFYCKYQFNKDGLFLPAIQRTKEWDTGDYLEYIEVRPSSVRLKSVPLRVAVESIAEYCKSNNYCTIKCKMYETCVNYIQNPDFPRFWQWLDGLAG